MFYLSVVKCSASTGFDNIVVSCMSLHTISVLSVPSRLDYSPRLIDGDLSRAVDTSAVLFVSRLSGVSAITVALLTMKPRSTSS